jgi:hypothetical protein
MKTLKKSFRQLQNIKTPKPNNSKKGYITEMVPELIWALDFFGSQDIWFPRNLVPKKFGPQEIWSPINLVPL